jgi:hypothetical protein
VLSNRDPEKPEIAKTEPEARVASCWNTTKTSFDIVTSGDDATAVLSKIANLENLGNAVCSQKEFGGGEQLKKVSTLHDVEHPSPAILQKNQ